MNDVCHNCGGSEIIVFYDAGEVPVQSCALLDDRQTALEYPTGALVLGYCKSCGFVANVAFESCKISASDAYEDQQAYSPRFRDFQASLIARIIARYDLHHKHVVEIGCGKGDFLVELCRTGANHGIGIDPCSDPARVDDAAPGSVRFIQEYVVDDHARLPCDFLVCRHTLEHIAETQGFVRTIRRVIGDRKNTIVFIEVPDTDRILVERAFWDVYYEHCSYFVPDSLARVFRENGFEVLDLYKDFDNQYLLMTARPTTSVAQSDFDNRIALEKLDSEVESFCREVAIFLGDWKARLAHIKKKGDRAVIWGSGSKCVAFLSAVGAGDEVSDDVVDINPHRHGKYLAGSGRRIVSPDTLRETRPDVIIAMNAIYREEIQRDLDKLGISARLAAV